MSRIHIHPFRNEAITIAENSLIRWNLNNGVSSFSSQVSLASRKAPPLAIAHDGSVLALPAPPLSEGGCAVEIREWDDFAVQNVIPIPESGIGLTAFAFSSDGRWLATADFFERVYLIDRITGSIACIAEGSEYTSALAFSPDARLLAALCTFQAGGHISVWHVGDRGLETSMQLDRNQISWHSDMDFADTFGFLSFSPDGFQLAACVTSQWLKRWLGWQGEVALYNVETGRLAWRVPLNDQVDGEPFYSDLVFASQENFILRGSSLGNVTILNRVDGSTARHIQVKGANQVQALADDRLGRGVWTIGSNGVPILVNIYA